MAKKLVAQEPPVGGVRHRSGINERILELAAAKPMRPVEVAQTLGLPTHQIATRMSMLVGRGQMQRIRSAGQTNGPGASTYQTVVAKRAVA